jgi:hypothetical protein
MLVKHRRTGLVTVGVEDLTEPAETKQLVEAVHAPLHGVELLGELLLGLVVLPRDFGDGDAVALDVLASEVDVVADRKEPILDFSLEARHGKLSDFGLLGESLDGLLLALDGLALIVDCLLKVEDCLPELVHCRNELGIFRCVANGSDAEILPLVSRDETC